MTTKTETLDALRRAKNLLSRCCVLLATPQVVDHLPGCVAEDLRELIWLNSAIQKAEAANSTLPTPTASRLMTFDQAKLNDRPVWEVSDWLYQAGPPYVDNDNIWATFHTGHASWTVKPDITVSTEQLAMFAQFVLELDPVQRYGATMTYEDGRGVLELINIGGVLVAYTTGSFHNPLRAK